jgi:hypothetical protein
VGGGGDITDLELYMTVKEGASNKSPAWDGISLEFYKTYWGVIKDDLLPLYN